VIKWKDLGVVMTFNALFQHLVRGTEENHETSQISNLETEIRKVKKKECEIIRFS
jgi:hypothetical protein